MPLNTRLQNISAALDPGIKAPDTTDMSSFNLAYQYGARAKEKRQDESMALEGVSSSLQGDQPKTVAQMLADFSALPPEQMYQKIGSMAAIGITKPGQNIIDTLTHIADRKTAIEQQSVQKQTAVLIARKQAEFDAGMVAANYNPQKPESVAAYKRNKSFQDAAIAAKTAEKSFDPSMLEDGWVDEGGRVDEQKLYSSIAKMPVSQTLASRETIALEQIASREKMAQELGDLRRDLLSAKTDADLEGLQMKLENNIEVQELRNEARVAVSDGQVSREQFINRQLNQTATRIASSKEGRNMTPEAVNTKAMKILGEAFDSEIGAKRDGGSAPPKDSAEVEAYRARIKAQFNSGAITREKALQLLRDTGLK